MKNVKKILIGDTGLIGTALKESINFDFSFNWDHTSSYKLFSRPLVPLYSLWKTH